MNPIQELIAHLLDDHTRADELVALDDEQLGAARQQLADHARAVRAGEVEGVDANDVAALTAIRDAVQVVRGEETRRSEIAAEAVAEAAAAAEVATALEAEILDEVVEPEIVEPAEAEIVEPEAEVIEPEVPIAATVESARVRPQRPAMADLIAARPEAARPRPNEMVARPRWQLRDGTAADARDLTSIAERMIAARADLLTAAPGIADKVTVASIKLDMPDELKVLHTDSPVEAERKMLAVTAAASEPDAVVASGGWCAPLEPRYEIPSVANAERPYRDSLPRVGADRGGIQHVRAGRLSSITTGGPATASAGVTLWTSATDTTPGDSTKTRQTIACRTVREETLDAVLYRLRFGNLQSRAFPEDVAHNIELAQSAHARIAERNLLDRLIADINVDVTQTGVVGTARDLKHHLMQARAQIRSVERLGDTPRIRAVLAREAIDMVVADLTLQQASGEIDALMVTEAQARAFLDSSGLVFAYPMDTPTGADAFVTNSDNENLADWPDDFEIPIYPEGSAVFLDGGTLDLGIVRDSTLNNTNDYEIFVETFEGIAWLGPFGLTLTLTTCPNGESQVATDETGSLCTGS